MKKKSLGAFSFKEFALEKPTGIDTKGNLVYPQDVFEDKSKSFASLQGLSADLQIKLAVERIKPEPNYKVGIIGVGSFTKKEIISHIQDETELGIQFRQAEINYCQELNQQLGASNLKLPADVNIKPVKAKLPADVAKLPTVLLPKLKTTALFLEDTTDSLTNLAATWRKANVHPYFAAQGFNVKVLQGNQDVRWYEQQEAVKPGVVYISGVGHGSPTVYTGHLGDNVFRVGNYQSAEVKNKHIHLLSCQTAKTLGPDMISKSATSYFGYFENFVFNFDVAGTPVNELNLFWMADSQIDFSLAAGRTVAQAHQDAIAKFNWAIAQVPNTAVATNLTWDRNYLRNAMTGAAWGTKPNATVPKFYNPFLIPVNP